MVPIRSELDHKPHGKCIKFMEALFRVSGYAIFHKAHFPSTDCKKSLVDEKYA